VGFWPALLVAPLLVVCAGCRLFERYCLRRVHKFGHVPELLITFGLFLILEMVQLVWGTAPPSIMACRQLQGPLFTLYGTQFPKYRAS
jgi:branched-chain amino acid transport system permease protein